jgi:hypothetical protein
VKVLQGIPTIAILHGCGLRYFVGPDAKYGSYNLVQMLIIHPVTSQCMSMKWSRMSSN